MSKQYKLITYPGGLTIKMNLCHKQLLINILLLSLPLALFIYALIELLKAPDFSLGHFIILSLVTLGLFYFLITSIVSYFRFSLQVNASGIIIRRNDWLFYECVENMSSEMICSFGIVCATYKKTRNPLPAWYIYFSDQVIDDDAMRVIIEAGGNREKDGVYNYIFITDEGEARAVYQAIGEVIDVHNR